MAVEAHAAAAGPTAGEYIVHHLTHASNKEMSGPFDLSVVHWDSMFFSILIGVIGCLTLWLAARKATAGVPGRRDLGRDGREPGQGHRAQRQ